uniref:disease resistance protein RPS4-like n=1 Tax=Fragaria vesca subsp. vesca TaxID=101020 RepID=UPI0005C8C4E6|nr:PREDICTED: disease resistance protein RPS4-like [Fragaria vesca subsp. vesca]
MMVGMVQVTPHFNLFQLAIPGSEIPVWFSNQSVGDSVTEKFPLDASNSKLIGFTACALIEVESPSAHRGVDPGICEIVWRWMKNYNKEWGLSCDWRQIVSDHLLLVVVPIRPLEDPCHEVTFDFEIYGKNNGCAKVTKCGARALFEHDMEELISKMNQSKRSISFYEATDEQEGAIVKATTCRSGGSDDEYYSAEE